MLFLSGPGYIGITCFPSMALTYQALPDLPLLKHNNISEVLCRLDDVASAFTDKDALRILS